MKGIQSEVKQFFKFQHCGVLFYDKIMQKLYTIGLEGDHSDKILGTRKKESGSDLDHKTSDSDLLLTPS